MLTLNASPLDATEQFVRDLPKVVQTVGKPVLDKLRDPMLAALKFYPPPPNYAYGKFPWKSERQRRFVMAKLRGQKYTRTFELRKAWRVYVETLNGRLVMSVINLADSAQFVVGRLNQRSRAEAAIPVQPFHAPRWRLAVDTVKPFFEKAETDFTKAMGGAFDDAIRVKATKRSKFR
jgi:hypothetical protein